MPPKAYMYPLPARYYDDYRIRRYGAHGTSHRYAAQQAANLLGRPLRDLGLITCHLGNGGSITAVNHGKSIDTTMGFTPLEGLMMGTRSGSIDPAILTYIMRREGISFDEMDAVLNRESGVLGVSGLSADMRDVLAAAEGPERPGRRPAEEKARKAVLRSVREGLGVAPATDRAKGKADAARRAQLIDVVNKAVDGKADELLAGSKDGSVYDALLDEVENGRAKDVQAEINRLLTAGKDKGNIKSKITEAVKEEYLAGSDRDREKLEKKLLALEDADENPLYEEKDFAQWVNQADKKAEKAKDERNWWEGVK